MEEPKNAKLFLALKSRYALHNTDRLVEFILDDQKTSFDFITEIIPQIEEENKKAPKLFKVTVDTVRENNKEIIDALFCRYK